MNTANYLICGFPNRVYKSPELSGSGTEAQLNP